MNKLLKLLEFMRWLKYLINNNNNNKHFNSKYIILNVSVKSILCYVKYYTYQLSSKLSRKCSSTDSNNCKSI